MILLILGFMFIIGLIIVLWISIHSYSMNIIQDTDSFVISQLSEERQFLDQRYKDLQVKINEVTPEYFDATYEELKAIEQELEANRKKLAKENCNICLQEV